MKKSISAILLVFAFLLLFVACGGENPGDKQKDSLYNVTIEFDYGGDISVKSSFTDLSGKQTITVSNTDLTCNNSKVTAEGETGYTFDGWYLPGETTSRTNSFTISAATTITAKYTANTYTVSFNGNGSESDPNPTSKTVTFGKPYGNLPPDLTTATDGVFFRGWYDDVTSGTEITPATIVTTASDHTLYAHWTNSGKYTVKIEIEYNGDLVYETRFIDLQGSQTIKINDDVIGCGDCTANARKKKGYTFDGWYLPGEATSKTDSFDVTSSTTITAKHTANKYTVKFDGNGADSPDPAEIVVTYGKPYGDCVQWPSVLTKTDYDFRGWYDDVTGGNEITSETDVKIDSDHTLYARWTEKPKYLCFTAEEANASIKMIKKGKPYSINLQYSTDVYAENWIDYTIGSTVVILENVGDKVYFKAKDINSNFSKNYQNYYCFVTSEGKVEVSGNIMSLIDAQCKATTLPEGCFASLFTKCSQIITASDLELPAKSLSKSCYLSMFKGCTGLKAAPELKALKLAESCYSSMFEGCTGLTSSPALPATTLAGYCYSFMFEDCTSLTTPSALPAGKLEMYCYYSMFDGCSSLKISECEVDDECSGTKIFTCPATGQFWEVLDMFKGACDTEGYFSGTPEQGKTYYYHL